MGQILSQSEIDAILTGLDLGSGSPLMPSTVQPVPANEDVTLYDFEHPVPLRSTQLDKLRLVSATVSQTLQTGLSSVMRTSVRVNFMGVEQSTFREYLATAEQPACLAVLESTTNRDTWFLDISRSLAFTMIDCLLGGGPSSPPQQATIERDFTDVETRLIDKALRAILPDLVGGFSNVTSLRMTRLISDASLTCESTSNEAVALVSFEVICGSQHGLMQLCVPWKHASENVCTVPIDPGDISELMRSGAVKVPVSATACITHLRVSARDLASLNPGDILMTDASPTSEISLEIDGRRIFSGLPGQIQDRKVIRLTSPQGAVGD